MRATLLFLWLCVLGSTPSLAAETCRTQATTKKLAGAALTSFMNKCERDVGAACEAQAGERKLAGAAKASFTKKCVSDTLGS
jgi:hypothetical protein